MKSNHLSGTIVACVLFGTFATSAFAGDKWYADGDTSWQFETGSNKTRAEVISELAASRAPILLAQDGSFEYSYPRIAGMVDGRSRAAIRAEATARNAAADPAADIYFGG